MQTASFRWKPALPMLGLAVCAVLATLAAPAHGADQAAPRVQRVAAADTPYALVRKDDGRFDISGSSDDRDEVRAAQRLIDGEFIWFRDGGRGYVIDDAATVARARAAWQPLDRMGEQMAVHDKEMERLGKNMEVLQQEMQRAKADQIQPAQSSAQAIGERMRVAGQPMGALGKQMGALGKEMARESKKADKTVRALIREARLKGLARAVPTEG